MQKRSCWLAHRRCAVIWERWIRLEAHKTSVMSDTDHPVRTVNRPHCAALMHASETHALWPQKVCCLCATHICITNTQTQTCILFASAFIRQSNRKVCILQAVHVDTRTGSVSRLSQDLHLQSSRVWSGCSGALDLSAVVTWCGVPFTCCLCVFAHYRSVIPFPY